MCNGRIEIIIGFLRYLADLLLQHFSWLLLLRLDNASYIPEYCVNIGMVYWPAKAYKVVY